MQHDNTENGDAKNTSAISRRMTLRRIRALSLGSASVVAVNAAMSRPVSAATEKLTESDPIAVALGYKIIATSVDTEKFPKRAGPEGAKQFCDNCALFANEAAGYGTCTAIPGKLVAAQGWCNAWIPQP